MIILIAGATHTGKTYQAQRLLEKYHYPYLSIDHLKMGMIRSGQTELSPLEDEALTAYLWPIVREMIKTAVENQQNLIIEGCYIPFDWSGYFSERYLSEIKFCCLIMSEGYINQHFEEIKNYENAVEFRLEPFDLTRQELIEANSNNLQQCRKYRCSYLMIDTEYPSDIDFEGLEQC